MNDNHTLHHKVANNEANEAYGGFLGVVMCKLMHTIAYQLDRRLCMMKWNEGYTQTRSEKKQKKRRVIQCTHLPTRAKSDQREGVR